VSEATDQVLEVGIGSGLNLPFYGEGLSHVVGLDPSPKLLQMTSEAARRSAIPLTLIEGTAEAVPIEDRSIDTVVTTLTLCSVPAENAGFRIERLDTGYMRGPKPMMFMYEGSARLG
jgi:ubiquinone/menaquinone biosynthesis C-methylase UbiE